jgi:hypothetical protein
MQLYYTYFSGLDGISEHIQNHADIGYIHPWTDTENEIKICIHEPLFLFQIHVQIPSPMLTQLLMILISSL